MLIAVMAGTMLWLLAAISQLENRGDRRVNWLPLIA
jgi:hypothetical protein